MRPRTVIAVLSLFLFIPLAHAPTVSQFTVTQIQVPWNIVLGSYATWYTVSYTVTNTGRNSTYWATFQIGSWEPCRTPILPIAHNQSSGESCIFSASDPHLPQDVGYYGTFFWVNGTLLAFGPTIFISTSLAGQGSGGHRYAV